MTCAAPFTSWRNLSDEEIGSGPFLCTPCFIKGEESWIKRLDEGIAETRRELETDRDPILRKFLRLQESTRANWAADLERMRAEEDRKRREKLEEAGIMSLLQSPEQKSRKSRAPTPP
jgi:hypothetical protein